MTVEPRDLDHKKFRMNERVCIIADGAWLGKTAHVVEKDGDVRYKVRIEGGKRTLWFPSRRIYSCPLPRTSSRR
jgi:hypothetical protein